MEERGDLKLSCPEDKVDAPDGPTQLGELIDDLTPLLKRAGARAYEKIVATPQSRKEATYDLLGTPDTVTVPVATDGLLIVSYRALWKESVAGAARAAIFVDAQQIEIPQAAGEPATSAAVTNSKVTDKYGFLSSFPGGLIAVPPGVSDTAEAAERATLIGFILGESADSRLEIGGAVRTLGAFGGVHGGVAVVEVPEAGDYGVSVQFKATSGEVTAKNRKLRVWAREFA